MELEEMKSLWQQYDNNIQKNNTLNDMIIKKMVQQNSKDIIGKMTGFEYLNISLGGIITILLVCAGPTFLKLPGVSGILTLCYLIAVITAFIALAANFYMINLLNQTDLTKPLTVALPQINKLSAFTAKGKVLNIIILPILITTAVAVGRKWVYDENIFANISFWGPILIVSLVIAIAATMLLYRTLYTNRLAAIRTNMKEIEQFAQE